MELIVINDHQLVSTPGHLGRRVRGSPPTAPSSFPQFEQMRQSVALTSNFAKSVVNLADVVSRAPLCSQI